MIVNLEIFKVNLINEALFIMLYKMVLTFKTADETLLCATVHEKSCCAVYNIDQVYYIFYMQSCA